MGLGVEWSGVGWWSMVARLATLSKRENAICVSRMSSVLGGLRTRSILGGLILDGDNLDGSVDELPVATMGVFFASAGVRSCRCWDAISPVL